MSVIPTADDLRTMNLAYRHMQRDFRNFAPQMFRTNSSISTDASGYILLPLTCYEVEGVYRSTNIKLYKIDIEDAFTETGWYEEGIDTSSSKRRLMVREAGAASAASVSFKVRYLIEYGDLSAVSDVPDPFGGKAYLDMITTLQAYYYLAEQGKEREKEKNERLKEYKMQLEMARSAYLDDEPTVGRTTHADAGDRQASPTLNVSSS